MHHATKIVSNRVGLQQQFLPSTNKFTTSIKTPKRHSGDKSQISQPDIIVNGPAQMELETSQSCVAIRFSLKITKHEL